MKWLSVAVALCNIGRNRICARTRSDKTSQDPNQWVMPLGQLQRDPPQQAEPDHHAERRASCRWPGRCRLGTLRGQEGQPLVIGNMMYLVSSYPELRLCHRPRQLLAHRLEVRSRSGQARAVGGLLRRREPRRRVCGRARFFVTTLDAHLYALDAKTGKVLWSVQERRSRSWGRR